MEGINGDRKIINKKNNKSNKKKIHFKSFTELNQREK